MPQMWVRNAVAEGIGALALTFVAVLTISAGGITPYALGQGLVVVALVAALGHVSGGHFNPAVTLAMYLSRRIDLMGASIYWAAQLIGGIVAAVVVLLAVNRDLVAAGAPDPLTEGDLNIVGAVVLEIIATFVLVLVVYGTIVDQRAPLSAYPLAIGLTYGAGILAIGGLTGGALNPARAFGPAVVGGEWGGIASWLVGPLVGAVLAWLVYEYVIGESALRDQPDDAVDAGLAGAGEVPTTPAAPPAPPAPPPGTTPAAGDERAAREPTQTGRAPAAVAAEAAAAEDAESAPEDAESAPEDAETTVEGDAEASTDEAEESSEPEEPGQSVVPGQKRHEPDQPAPESEQESDKPVQADQGEAAQAGQSTAQAKPGQATQGKRKPARSGRASSKSSPPRRT